MCGICCVLRKHNAISFNDVLEKSAIKNRGPDYWGSHTVSLSDDVSLLFGGFVLHLRGCMTPQPLTDDQNNTFLWNGEVFGGITLSEDDNDTKALFDRLTQADQDQDIFHILTALHGPWTFIYWQATKKKLWFGRDVFGRRSLLWHLPVNETDVFALSSVQIQPYEFEEVPSVGLYCLDFGVTNTTNNYIPKLTVYPWKDGTWPGTLESVVDEKFSEKLYQNLTYFQITLQPELKLPSWMPVINNELPLPDFKTLKLESETASGNCEEMYREQLQSILDDEKVMRSAMEQLMDLLLKAVHKRVYNLPRKYQTRHDDSQLNKMNNIDIQEEVNNGHIKQTLDGLHDNEGVEIEYMEGIAKVAILFSGGIDSTVIAALADRCVPPGEEIDLINVAFEQSLKSTSQRMGKKKDSRCNATETSPVVDKFAVPDRLTGFVALSELNPDRKWNFVEVNVMQEELKVFRTQYVRHLIYPLDSVLDDSIGCAVWFAARGKGILGNGQHKGQAYMSRAKVIICGMGADEQLAGYSRHRVRYRDHGWQGVVNEVDMEMKRISARNLGRDDRIIGDHGRESRFPFLDEEVVSYLAHLPIHIKADLSLPRGVGEKLVLRLLALELGLPLTAVLPKRAIQFGSRIAKIENSKEKASDVCCRLKGSSQTNAVL